MGGSRLISEDGCAGFSKMIQREDAKARRYHRKDEYGWTLHSGAAVASE
jgi:hypothetical protein